MKKGKDPRNAPSFDQVELKDVDAAFRNILAVGTLTFAPFFRRRVGDRYYRMGAISLLWMAGFLASPFMWWFFPAWLLFAAVGRVDRDAHSEWGGVSRLNFLGPVVARFVEPFIVFGFGVACAQFDETFAFFVFVGAAAMFGTAFMEVSAVRKLKRDIRDGGWMMRVHNDMRRR